MKLRILGSSGNSCTPWPTCTCRVCTLARERGGKDQRYGNHLYLAEEGVLTDVSEHIFTQLDRQRIMKVDHVFISHWHPDHTAGVRVLQALAGFFLRRKERTLKLYMTSEVFELVRTLISPALDYYLGNSDTELVLIEDGRAFEIGKLRITPVTTNEHAGSDEKPITYFLFERDGKRVFFAPDETKYLDLSRPELRDLDVLIKECGYFTHDVNGERAVPDGFEQNVPDEIRFEESLEQVRAIAAKRTILTELEELFQRTPEDYEALAASLDEPIEFAYDGMELEL